MRHYELVYIADPRLSDEEVVALGDEYKRMIETAGGTITREESWGKRKLAYPIRKLAEGHYTVLYVRSDNGSPLGEVEHRMRQNEQVLRYLSVRTDIERPAGEASPEEES